MTSTETMRRSYSTSSCRGRVESIVRITIAFCIVRTWCAESFVVPTGSMAETVVGVHRDVVCADCGQPFSCGSDEIADYLAATNHAPLRAVCPNCGFFENDLAAQRDISGDRLLVHKSAFAFDAPQRWGIAVFRMPEIARMVFIKRIVGLPNESILIRDGDVYVDGRLARKSLAEQRASAVLVHDSRYKPSRHMYLPERWRGEETTAWREEQGRYVWRPAPVATSNGSAESAARAQADWLTYHHWRRVPGDSSRVEETPVTDDSGYNQTRPRRVEHVSNVRDLMLRCRIRASATGKLAFYITDGRDVFVAQVDTATGQSELQHNGLLVASASAAASLPLADSLVELSIVDRQFLLAIEDRLVFDPYAYGPASLPLQPPTRPLAIGSVGAELEVSELAVLRDIYYTRPLHGRWAIDTAYTLGPDEYFALGDNSALSDDSRMWQSGPAVPAEMLVGRPLFVHIPCRLWDLGNLTLQVPDLTKMRAIH